jgi:hypothetical protein
LGSIPTVDAAQPGDHCFEFGPTGIGLHSSWRVVIVNPAAAAAAAMAGQRRSVQARGPENPIESSHAKPLN